MLCVVEPEGISSQCDLYLGFLQVMSLQVTSMDRDLLQVRPRIGSMQIVVLDFVSLSYNFKDLEVSEGTFLFTYFKSLSGSISRSSANTVLGDALSSFRRVLMNRFPTFFSDQFFDPDCNLEMVEGVLFEDEDDDGPIVVAEEEFSAAMARSSPLEALATPKDIQEIYPLLVAAIQTHEDILMTCARALDEASDVSLVREAASYLQTIEQYR